MNPSISNAFNNIKKQTNSTIGTFEKANMKLSSFGNIAKKALGAVGLAVSGVAIKSFLGNCAEASQGATEATTKLQAVLMNTPGMTQAGIDSIKNYAGELTKTGVVSKTVAINGAQQLGTYQLQSNTIKTLLPGMEDLIAQTKGVNATSEDAVSIGNLIGKVMTGNTGALSKQGIIFNQAQEKILKYGNEEQKAATLAEVLKQNVGGVNKALSETDAGKIKQEQMAIAGIKVTVGNLVNDVKGKLAVAISGVLPKIADGIKTAVDGFLSLSDSISKMFDNTLDVGDKYEILAEGVTDFLYAIFPTSIANTLSNIYLVVQDRIFDIVDVVTSHKKEIGDLANTFKKIGPAVLAAVATFKTMNKAVTIIGNIKTAISGFKTSFLGIKAVLAANPFSIVIIAVTALVAILVYAYQNSETFRNFINQLLVKFMEFGSYIGQILGPILTSLGDWFTNTILPILASIGNSLLALWNGVISPFISWLVATLGPIFSTIFPILIQYVASFFSGIGQYIQGALIEFQGIIDFITGVFTGNWSLAWSGIKEIFSGAFQGLVGIAKGPINAIIDLVNSAIEKINGALSFSVPDWVPGIGGNSFNCNIPTIPQFANGGFTHGISIAGEAGTEAIIPMKRNNPRSIGLLDQAADRIGYNREKQTPTFIFAPKIYGNADAEAINKIQEEFEKFKEMVIEAFEDERRTSFE